MKMVHPIIILLLFSMCCMSCGHESENKNLSSNNLPDKIDFNFHIRPILSDRCYKCHGPDEKTRKANLRLDLESFAFAPLDSLEDRYAIVPGNVEKSLLIQRITSTDPEEIMPPPEAKLHVSDREIALLKRWIKEGAEWKSHWAFIPPKRPNQPEVVDKKWPKNEMDYFILNKLEQEQLRPSAPAKKEKLIRRLSFDLRGLPPSLEEIDQFIADEDPNAYENLIDQILSEASYGERMASEWLDLARYADSHGYQDDLERSMWPWRDWVIQAFNSNMPYNDFVRWQLAGDLLPNASYEQKLATAFNRNHKITQEVGVVDEEYRVEYVLDRVNTFSTSFIGLTVACAQCHDHKFDPISQKEFYSLFSFFNNVPEKGRVEYSVEVAEPSLPLPEETVEKYKTYIDGLVAKQEEKIIDYEAKQWAEAAMPSNLKEKSVNLPDGLVHYFPLDYAENQITFDPNDPNKQAKLVNGPVPIAGKFSGGYEFNGENYLDISSINSFRFDQAFSISCWIYSIHGGISGPILTAYNDQSNSKIEFLVDGNKRFQLGMNGPGKNNRLRVVSREEIPENRWVNLVLTYDGSKKVAGIQLYMDGKALEKLNWGDQLKRIPPQFQTISIGTRRANKLALGYALQGIVSGRLDEVQFFNKALSSDAVTSLSTYNPIHQIQTKASFSESDKKRLFHQKLQHEDGQYQVLIDRLRAYKIRQVRMADVVLKPTMIMQDMDTLRPTFVLERGQYNQPTTPVQAGTPKQVLPFPEGKPKNRLGLSEWLFDSKHPLTARVAVNRYWQMLFGSGIVGTPEDFGSQGALPSHPELLDWLAVEFQTSGWDTKKLIKTMVSSATYQQSTATTAKLETIDPENRLLARGPQTRLPAEMVRDHALAISGLLSTKLGGPSVKPYQPEGLWLQVASGNQPLRQYIQDHDEDLYRKSMYTFRKRTVPPPSMITFDAPTREQCVVKRQATNTPMQALVLLNDPQFIEASRLMAVRMLLEGGENSIDKIQFAFRLATSRFPNQKELNLLEELYLKKQTLFKTEPQEAKKLLAIGEYQTTDKLDTATLAAYTIVANTILNLTESIRKG